MTTPIILTTGRTVPAPTRMNAGGGRIIVLHRRSMWMPPVDGPQMLIDAHGHPEIALLVDRIFDLDHSGFLSEAEAKTLTEIGMQIERGVLAHKRRIREFHDPAMLLHQSGSRVQWAEIEAQIKLDARNGRYETWRALEYFHRCREYVERLEAKYGLFGHDAGGR